MLARHYESSEEGHCGAWVQEANGSADGVGWRGVPAQTPSAWITDAYACAHAHIHTHRFPPPESQLSLKDCEVSDLRFQSLSHSERNVN